MAVRCGGCEAGRRRQVHQVAGDGGRPPGQPGSSGPLAAAACRPQRRRCGSGFPTREATATPPCLRRRRRARQVGRSAGGGGSPMQEAIATPASRRRWGRATLAPAPIKVAKASLVGGCRAATVALPQRGRRAEHPRFVMRAAAQAGQGAAARGETRCGAAGSAALSHGRGAGGAGCGAAWGEAAACAQRGQRRRGVGHAASGSTRPGARGQARRATDMEAGVAPEPYDRNRTPPRLLQ
ncbi:hypothetical protein ACP70R_015510 [Stipagrostis hirtigluma subsp. patula]